MSCVKTTLQPLTEYHQYSEAINWDYNLVKQTSSSEKVLCFQLWTWNWRDDLDKQYAHAVLLFFSLAIRGEVKCTLANTKNDLTKAVTVGFLFGKHSCEECNIYLKDCCYTPLLCYLWDCWTIRSNPTLSWHLWNLCSCMELPLLVLITWLVTTVLILGCFFSTRYHTRYHHLLSETECMWDKIWCIVIWNRELFTCRLERKLNRGVRCETWALVPIFLRLYTCVGSLWLQTLVACRMMTQTAEAS